MEHISLHYTWSTDTVYRTQMGQTGDKLHRKVKTKKFKICKNILALHGKILSCRSSQDTNTATELWSITAASCKPALISLPPVQPACIIIHNGAHSTTQQYTNSVTQLTSGCMALNTGKSITVIWLWKHGHKAIINRISALAKQHKVYSVHKETMFLSITVPLNIIRVFVINDQLIMSNVVLQINDKQGVSSKSSTQWQCILYAEW